MLSKIPDETHFKQYHAMFKSLQSVVHNLQSILRNYSQANN